MAEIKIKFNHPINSSAQVGDTVYFCPTQDSIVEQGFNMQQGEMVEAGVIIEIQYDFDFTGESVNPYIVVDQTLTPNEGETILDASAYAPVANQDFIFFSKDNAVNMSSPVGYFARVKLVNNSKIKSEIFAVACEVFESSK